ncbi:hypothetical protein AUR04nite_12620 [Glutamicibacter uratoxydans]|uniref:Uncharacterized protein n=1 Tax=Glutamicibacter uratoxydans TaxID=43667 RepID=A0A4Y4DQC1_GLUUR|nr:hypothetical protein [Glutamicibacter uratoxydans]GED05730.1 hypothetical protein AUR04nite_12620 [Glutamicibacter uratoxydans]
MADRSKDRAKNILILFLIIVLSFGTIATFRILDGYGSQPDAEKTHYNQEESNDADKQPTYQGLLAPEPDFSSPKSLAISLSFPLFGLGDKPYPASYTGGGNADQVLASKQYYEAKARAHSIALAANNLVPPNSTRNFADCGAFVATVIVNTVDPSYPGLLVYKQRAYVQNPSNGWVKVGSSTTPNKNTLKVGDVFISSAEQRSGHTWIWLGRVDGIDNVIADASFGTDESSTAHLPVLRRNPIDGAREDARGREYDIWRYVGKK